MQNDEDLNSEENIGDNIRMSNFSMVLAFVFVTLVMAFLFIKIVFD